MSRILFLLCAVSLAWGAKWQKVNAGPFEIYTDQDVKTAKQLLGDLEQLRHQVEALTGVQDPKPLWPIRLVVAKGQAATSLQLTTAYQHMVTPSATLDRVQKKQLVIALLYPNSGPLEPSLDAALLSVLAGLESSGSRVTLGALPPRAEQSEDWVLVNYLVTNELYRGRLRVFLGNLMRGADKASALRNGFEETEAELRQKAGAARASFAPVTFPAKPILPERDYRAREIEDAEAQLELAIARLDRNGCAVSKELAAMECMAATSRSAEAALAAIAAGSRNPRMHYLAAVLQAERLEHQKQLFTALQLKSLYPEAALAFAGQENDPQKALKALKDASPAALRNPIYLAKMAAVAEGAGQYAEAAKAWAAAERATFDAVEKERLRSSRLRSVDQRLEAEATARKAAEEARLRDIERVRQESLARVRAAEAQARAKLEPLSDDEKVVDWWEGQQPNAYFIGRLTRIECLGGGKARFAITSETETLLFDVEDPSKIVVSGAGAETLQFRCGNQASAPKVRAGYLSATAPTPAATPAQATIDPNFQLKVDSPEGKLKTRPNPNTEAESDSVTAAKTASKVKVPLRGAATAKQAPQKTATQGKLLSLELKP